MVKAQRILTEKTLDKNQTFLLEKIVFGLSQFSHVLHACELAALYEQMIALRNELMEVLDRQEMAHEKA